MDHHSIEMESNPANIDEYKKGGQFRVSDDQYQISRTAEMAKTIITESLFLR